MVEHVVVAGGGVGALEAVLALQSLAPGPLSISVLTGQRHLTYRPLAVAEPFGGEPPLRLQWSEIARDRGVRWIPDVLVGVRADAREIDTRDGPPVRYDALLLALGAIPEPTLAGALTFAGPRDVLAVREAIERLEPGRRHRLAFVVVASNAWTLPLYELALLTAAYGRREGLDLAIDVVTSEPAPLAVFGAEASDAVSERLASAGIRLRTRTSASKVEGGRLWLDQDGPTDVDLVVGLPRLRGPAVPGLPHDADGFVPVDRTGRVRDLAAVWAVGDMTTHPVKQGGLATQQADLAAAEIAVLAGAQIDVKAYEPVLRGMLLTGEEPDYLQRRMRMPLSSEVSSESLWYPAQKIAGRHLGPYLAAFDASSG
jgi:sulfide:quinone oxidoreductase